MNDRELNHHVALLCGWTYLKDFVGPTDLGVGTSRGNAWLPPGKVLEKMEWFEVAELFRTEPPDYCNDLNAMHEAEKFLLPDDASYSQRNYYANKLGSLTNNDNGRGWQPLSNDDCFPILHATARQRAEAFVYVFKNA